MNMKRQDPPLPVPGDLQSIQQLRNAKSLQEQFRVIRQLHQYDGEQRDQIVKSIFYWSVDCPKIRKNVKGCLSRMNMGTEIQLEIYREILLHGAPSTNSSPLMAIRDALDAFELQPQLEYIQPFLLSHIISHQQSSLLQNSQELQAWVNLVNQFPCQNSEIEEFLWYLVTENDNADIASVAAIAYVRINHNHTHILDLLETASLSQQPEVCLLYGCILVKTKEELESLPDSKINPQESVCQCILQKLAHHLKQQATHDVQVMAINSLKVLLTKTQSSQAAEQALDIVFGYWEKISISRKIRGMIESLFRDIVPLLERRDSSLLERILHMPVQRRGRYTALEALLPYLTTAEPHFLEAILKDLTHRIGEFGHNHAVMSDLWVSVVKKLRGDSRRTPGAGNNSSQQISEGSPTSIWARPLALGLVHPLLSFRKYVSAFVLFRLADICDKERSHHELAAYFESLLLEIDTITLPSVYHSNQSESPGIYETFSDRILWARLESIRAAKASGALDFVPNPLRESIRKAVTREDLLTAASHFSPSMRLAAIQSFGPWLELDNLLFEETNRIEYVRKTLYMWKLMLPPSSKYDAREYITTIMRVLFDGLREILLSDDPNLLLELRTFILSFLVEEMIIRVAYPGSTKECQIFAVGLIESLLVFVCPTAPKYKYYWVHSDGKKGSDFEEDGSTRSRFFDRIVGDERFGIVTTACIVLLNTIWDSVKKQAFGLSQIMVWILHNGKLSCKDRLVGVNDMPIDLALRKASTKRQRDADTGSYLLSLSLLCGRANRKGNVAVIMQDIDSKFDYLIHNITQLLSSHSNMQGAGVPMIHGIVRALGLTILSVQSNAFNISFNESDLIDMLVTALQISLIMVADVADSRHLVALEGTTQNAQDLLNFQQQIKASKKINPGAIGANGIFSTTENLTDEDLLERSVSQQLVVGAWMLVKESCEALATTVGSLGSLSLDDAKNIGSILISAMTSLKHTGAAYAAHNSLQRIAEKCCKDTNTESSRIFDAWLQRVFSEVNDETVVRDSMLRRSTGIALCFLSILRPFAKSKVSKGTENAISELLLNTIPPEACVIRSRLVHDTKDFDDLFSFLSSEAIAEALHRDQGERTRVHALNILRLIVLDKEMAQLSTKVIGDCLAVTSIGFTDPSWAVRNSATMLFTACMLRAIDADRNASKRQTQGTRAVSLAELFHHYECLPTIFRRIFSTNRSLKMDPERPGSLPPVLPLLLVLARVEPLSDSVEDMSDFISSIWPLVYPFIAHRHIAVRKIAARCIVNISLGDKDFQSLLQDAKTAVEHISSGAFINWNGFHGSLLVCKELILKRRIAPTKELNDYSENLNTLVRHSDPNSRLPPLCRYAACEVIQLVHNESTALRAQLEFDPVGDSPGMAELRMVLAYQRASMWKHCKLFVSENFDSILWEAKALKRNVYDLGGMDSFDQDDKRNVLPNLISDIIRFIEDRIIGKVRLSTPTLRRLCRVIIECEEQIPRARDFDELRETISRFGWNLLDKRAELIDYPTQLLGNVIELITCNESLNDGEKERLLRIISKSLRDPENHWRLRHSGAKALKPFLLEFSTEAKLTYLKYLQDPDVDVRHVCVKNFHSLTGIQTSDRMEIPEIILQRAFRLFSKNVDFVSDICNEFLNSLGKVPTEISKQLQSMESSDDSGSVFVEEDKNAYLDRALWNQLCVLCLYEKGVGILQDRWDYVSGLFSTSTSLIFRALPFLQVYPLFDITCVDSVFLPLHSLILVACIGSRNGQITRVEEVSSLCAFPHLHPEIRSALQLLIDSRSDESLIGTWDIRRHLFMLQLETTVYETT